VSGRRAKAGARQETREERRGHLIKQWKANCERRKAGWLAQDHPNFSAVAYNVDAEGNLTIEPAREAMQKTHQRIAELQAKVDRWPNRKELNGQDIIEVLELAFALTNNPAYRAAQDAMGLHRLDRDGLKRAFVNLLRRHFEPPELSAVADSGFEDSPDSVTWFMEEFGYGLREAVEHVVAADGIPGPTFEAAVEKVRKAYSKRKIHSAEREQYLNELSGLRGRRIIR
jgi:hypothetical protein